MTQLNRLPRTTQEAWEWQYRGICRSDDPRLFFHPDGERGAARRRRDQAALALCIRCPVLESCRRHALSVREPYGVWGGLTEEDRQLAFQRSRFADPPARHGDESVAAGTPPSSDPAGDSADLPGAHRAAASA